MEGIILVSPLLFLMVTAVSSKTIHGNCTKRDVVSLFYPAYPEFLYNPPEQFVFLPHEPGSLIKEKYVTGSSFWATFRP